ncbi:MAG: glutamate racemase [Deltaproteobacteria bacterium]|nr:glutamate racemase [Deltaproteobacteria bacterium]
MTSANQRDLPIGIFDSGLGGLTVFKELRRHLPNERFIYLGDTARTPYGSKGKETIQRYSLECAQFLQTQKIKLLVVACNTASSFALETLIEQCSCPVIGTIDPAVRQALSVDTVRRVGVIGTKGTIASAAYDQKLRSSGRSLEIFSKACPLFVPLVEEGLYSGNIVEQVVEHYLSELKALALDALILGCTHYPLLAPSIVRFLGTHTRIIECSKAIALEVEELLEQRQLSRVVGAAAAESERYFVTDDVDRFNYLASLFLEKRPVEAVHVEHLSVA